MPGEREHIVQGTVWGTDDEIVSPVEEVEEVVDDQEAQEADEEEDYRQLALFDLKPTWWEHWQGMPEYVQEDLSPWKSLLVHFESRADLKAFAKLVDQKITDRTQSIWYPEATIERYVDKRYISLSEED